MRATFFLVYPFHHNSSADELVAGTTVPVEWAHWFTRLDDPAFAVAVDHSYSFIPPVRAILTPELFGRTSLPQDWRARLGTIAELRSSFARVDATTTLRETYLNRALRITRRGASWLQRPIQLVDPGTGQGIGSTFTVRWADAVLFPDHVGVFLLRVDLWATELDDIAMMSRHVKKIAFRRRLSVDVPILSLGNDERTTWADVLRELSVGLVGDERGHADLLRSEYSTTSGVNWRLGAFIACDERQSPIDLRKVAFHVATGRGPSQLTNQPSETHMTNLQRKNYLDIWESWTALHHYDNFVFVADATDERLAGEAIAHAEIFEYEYLVIYVYALGLRTALDLLAGDIATTPPQTVAAQHHVNNLYGNLIRFNTRMWFDQIAVSPIGPPMFKMLRECLGLGDQHTQVFADAQRLSDHLDARTGAYRTRLAERTEAMLQFLSMIAIPLSVYITILQPTLFRAKWLSELSSSEAWGLLFVTFLLLSLAWLAVRRFQRGGHDEL